MTGVQPWRRGLVAVAAALAVTSGLLIAAPVGARSAAPDGPGAPPPLAWPEVPPVIPEAVPPPEGALAVPDDWASPVPAVVRRGAVAPVKAAELIALRGESQEVWENTDGTETVVLHGRPTYYQPDGSTAWEPIDTRLIPDPDRPGWFRTTAGAWTARFGPLEPGGLGGLELETKAGPVRSVADLPPEQAAIAPVVSEDGREVTYVDVWPGVDLRYRLSNAGLAQGIVIRHPGCESFRFLVEGLGLTATPETEAEGRLDVTGEQAGTVRLEPSEVVRAAAVPSDLLARLAMHVREADPALVGDDPDVPGLPQDMEISVAGSWLDRALAAGEGPIVLDSTSLVGATGIDAHRVVDGETTSQAHRSSVRAGHRPGDPPGRWRSAVSVEYLPAIQGRQLLQAQLLLSGRADQNTRRLGLKVRDAVPGSFDGMAGDGTDRAEPDIEPAPADLAVDVTDLVTSWQTTNRADGAIGLVAADEDPSSDSYVRFDGARVELTVNEPAPAPALAAPSPDALAVTTTTPTLSWAEAADPDGDPVQYVARLATGLDADSGLVATSPPGTATSWTVPAGLLQDGLAYTWRVFASDGRSWTPSEVRRLTVDRRAGTAPTDPAGPVSTDLVTGAAAVAVAGPVLSTVRGDVGLRLLHDTLASTRGLVGTYRADVDRNTTIDESDPIRLVRRDAQLSFAWDRPGAAAASPGVPTEWFSVRWAGFVALPEGTWQLGARSGDGVRISVDGERVLDRWMVGPPAATPDYQEGSVAGGGVHEIEVDYFQAAEDASMQLWVRNADAPDQAFVVPAAWLSPVEPSLPAGWTFDVAAAETEYVRATVAEGSVTLVRPDGTPRTFVRAPGPGAAYIAPPGAEDLVTVNPDGTVTVRTESGRTLVFEPGGRLARVGSAADEPTRAAVAPSYDERGRLERLTDPISGRSLRVVYAPSDSCADPSTVDSPEPLDAAPTGMVCQVAYWDGTATDLFYRHGLLAYVRNPGDESWGFGYDAAGRLAEVVDPLAFDAARAGVVDGVKVAHRIGYDAAGRVAAVSRPEVTPDVLATHDYSYAPVLDLSGELLSGRTSVARNGSGAPTRTVGYDARARPIESVDAAGGVTRTTWDGDDRVVAVDRPDGVRTTTRYDHAGHPTDTWGPAPAELFAPDGSGGPEVPHEQTRYDEDFAGQQVQYWDNVELTGAPAVHAWQPGSLSALDWATDPPVAGVPADGWSARFSGSLSFPAAGTYTLQLYKDDQARVFLDDRVVLDAWDTPAGWSDGVTFEVGAAGETHRLRVDLVDVSGPAALQLQWTPPGAAAPEAIPGELFSPDFGLPSTRVDADGDVVAFSYVDSEAGIGPQHRLPVRAIVDPVGLVLVESTGYEPAGTGVFRLISHVRPAGPETTSTVVHYGDQEERDNPCTRPSDAANQAGLPKLDEGPDPDGDGPGQARVHEVVYDEAGRVVAARVVGDEDWTCTAYDGRGRVISVRYPAFGDQPGRTVTYDHAADPDGDGEQPRTPLALATRDEAGTVLHESDLWGRPTAVTDVFGARTATSYDELGQKVRTQGRAGTVETTYDAAGRVSSITRDGQVVASDLGYDAAGRVTAVAYPGNGTTGSLTYDARGQLVAVSWSGPDGSLLTSEVVTRRLGGAVADRVIDGEDHHPGDDYGYDGAGRILGAWLPPRHVTYQFAVHDGCGPLAAAGANSNRTHHLVEGGPVTCYCYDRADRLVAADTATGTIAYDAHDNMTSVFGENRRYDAADRLTEIVSGAAGTTVTYRRDATDRIVERLVNGTVVARYGDGYTTDADDAVVEATLDLPGGVLLTSRTEGSVWSYPNVDGDVAAVADQSGTKQGDTIVYDPMGNIVGGSPPDNAIGHLDYGWRGRQLGPLEHEPGLQPVVQQGARQYAPVLGRVL